MYDIIREIRLGKEGLIFMALDPELMSDPKDWKGLRVEWSFGNKDDNRITVVDSNALMVLVHASRVEVYAKDGQPKSVMPICPRMLAKDKLENTGESDFVMVRIADEAIGEEWQLVTGVNGDGFVQLFHYGIDYNRGNEPKGAYVFLDEDTLIPVDDHPTEYGDKARNLEAVAKAMTRRLEKCGFKPDYWV